MERERSYSLISGYRNVCHLVHGRVVRSVMIQYTKCETLATNLDSPITLLLLLLLLLRMAPSPRDARLCPTTKKNTKTTAKTSTSAVQNAAHPLQQALQRSRSPAEGDQGHSSILRVHQLPPPLLEHRAHASDGLRGLRHAQRVEAVRRAARPGSRRGPARQALRCRDVGGGSLVFL